jgi:transcriptional regulator with XRE-family HTH domain
VDTAGRRAEHGAVAGRRPELAAFLTAARARLRPADVGVPDTGRRRTPGLRRQEVAQLAAVSVDWYTRLEQGRVGMPGAAVLDALAEALRMSDPERRHLHVIARDEVPARRERAVPVRGSLLALLDGVPLLPAYVADFRFDVLAHNDAAAALFGPGFGEGEAGNVLRTLFLDETSRALQLDWERVAREMVGNVRANLARHRDDARLRELVTELCCRSPEFAEWWAGLTVQERTHGRKRLRHPAGGELTLCYDVLGALDGSDRRLVVLTPADAATERALRRIVARHSGVLAGATRGAEGAVARAQMASR